MADWGERTAEEREAARREQERRRVEGDGEHVAPDDAGPLGPEEHEEHDEERDDEVALGTRRVTRGDRPRTGGAADPAAAKTGGHGERPEQDRSRHSLAMRGVALVAALLVAALIWFLVELFQPFQGSGHGSVTVILPPHSSVSKVGSLLERDGVVASGFFFDLRATLAGERDSLRSGTYHLKRDMSYGQVLKILTTAPPPARVTYLTLTEGRTRSQIDALLRAQGVAGSYLAATRSSPLLDPRQYGAPPTTPSLEGFMFPSTYQLRQPISIGALVADQLSTFRQRFATVNLSYPQSRHLSAYDVLIIASMVEAEAKTARDRPLVASVIYNRLADGMPLQIDATTRYATNNYTAPLTVSELNSPSPYNTRIHKGLPPTPIDNPGLASIQAAAQPAISNYLYFVVKPCGNGEHAFASSYSQFQAEVQQYQVARAQRGGRSPAGC